MPLDVQEKQARGKCYEQENQEDCFLFKMIAEVFLVHDNNFFCTQEKTAVTRDGPFNLVGGGGGRVELISGNIFPCPIFGKTIVFLLQSSSGLFVRILNNWQGSSAF